MLILNRKRETAALWMRTVALVILISPGAGVLAANTSATMEAPAVEHTEMQAAANQGADSVCQVLQEASDKLFTTPFHMFMTQTIAGVENGRPMSSETIFVGGARYVMVNGKWSASPLSTEEMKAMEQRNRKNARNVSCHYARDEQMNGESAAVYSAHSESEHGKDDSQIWISKSKGLTLRQETDLDAGDGRAKMHLSVRYEYSNVQAPKL